MCDRGWGNSCGGTDPKRLQPVCANGYNHLMDTRYEVRDAQEVWEALADAGLIDPQAIAATGGSYGGGISMALGALRNRQMQPDGTLVPWVSAGGKPMQIAAVAARHPLDRPRLLAAAQRRHARLRRRRSVSGPERRPPIGVMKQSFVAGLYGLGRRTSNYAPAGVRPRRRPDQLVRARSTPASPTTPNPLAARHRRRAHHPPLLVLHRRLDRARADADLQRLDRRPLPARRGDPLLQPHPRRAPGHADLADLPRPRPPARPEQGRRPAILAARQPHAWFDHYVKRTGPSPFQGVQTLTTTCDPASPAAHRSLDDLATDGPDLARRSPPARSASRRAAAKTIVAPAPTRRRRPGLRPDRRRRRLRHRRRAPTRPASPPTGSTRPPAGGYTLMGSPTVVASIAAPRPPPRSPPACSTSPPTATETLVARGLYRPDRRAGPQVFQLHPTAGASPTGHVAKLELLPADVAVRPRLQRPGCRSPSPTCELRLPVVEQPGTGPVQAPAAEGPAARLRARPGLHAVTPIEIVLVTGRQKPGGRRGVGAANGKYGGQRHPGCGTERCRSESASMTTPCASASAMCWKRAVTSSARELPASTA